MKNMRLTALFCAIAILMMLMAGCGDTPPADSPEPEKEVTSISATAGDNKIEAVWFPVTDGGTPEIDYGELPLLEVEHGVNSLVITADGDADRLHIEEDYGEITAEGINSRRLAHDVERDSGHAFSIDVSGRALLGDETSYYYIAGEGGFFAFGALFCAEPEPELTSEEILSSVDALIERMYLVTSSLALTITDAETEESATEYVMEDAALVKDAIAKFAWRKSEAAGIKSDEYTITISEASQKPESYIRLYEGSAAALVVDGDDAVYYELALRDEPEAYNTEYFEFTPARAVKYVYDRAQYSVDRLETIHDGDGEITALTFLDDYAALLMNLPDGNIKRVSDFRPLGVEKIEMSGDGGTLSFTVSYAVKPEYPDAVEWLDEGEAKSGSGVQLRSYMLYTNRVSLKLAGGGIWSMAAE